MILTFMMKIANKLAKMVRYVFRYAVSIKPGKLNALNYRDTIGLISENKLSLIRWGDGETSVLLGYDIAYQVSTAELRNKMREIITTYNNRGIESGYLLAMPLKYLFYDGFTLFNEKLCKYWVHTRYLFKTSLNKNNKYGDAFLFSEGMNQYYEKIWENASHIIFVHSGLNYYKKFCSTYKKNTFFVEIPEKNCFGRYKEIEEEIVNIIEANRLDTKKTYVLISAGPAAKVIVFDLAQKGLICIDTGHCWDDPLSRDAVLT